MALPFTNSEVWYAYTIKIQGQEVGTLRSFAPTQTRTFEYVREIGTNGGHIFEGVPGITDYKIHLEKVRLYTKRILDYFGIAMHDIQNQIHSIDIQETTYKSAVPPDADPVNANLDGARSSNRNLGAGGIGILNYEECWITSWGKTVAVGTVLVIETMDVQPVRVSAIP